MRLKRVTAVVLTLLVAVAVLAGSVTGAWTLVGRSALYATGLWSPASSSTLPPGALDGAAGQPDAAPPATVPRAVLAADAPGPEVRPERVAARLRTATSGGPTDVRGLVVAVESGAVGYARRAAAPAIPASTMKLLTGAAALSALGPDHRFRTRVVRAGPGSIVLVGGGDPYLARRDNPAAYPERASLPGLARATAAVLRAQRVTAVTVGYDTSLFSGPTRSPTWPASYATHASPVSALWADQGRVTGGSPGPRLRDPAREAARVFAAALTRAGVRVQAVRPQPAPEGAASVAEVRSMPLDRVVEQMLRVSDNDAAEVLFRHVAVAKNLPGSYAGARRAVEGELRRMGAWGSGAVVHDGSGLSRAARLRADMLVAVLRMAATAARPELRALLTGLPVAGVEGSLRGRFFDDRTLAGRGVVRGKTGTLRQVHGLAGYVRTADGSVLVYAFLVNGARSDYAARVWLDRVTAALSGCGCR